MRLTIVEISGIGSVTAELSTRCSIDNDMTIPRVYYISHYITLIYE